MHVLKATKKVMISVSYSDLEDHIEAESGHRIEIPGVLECSNDSQHRFNVKPELSPWHQKTYDKFCATGEAGSYSLGAILNGLCKDGKLEPGEYLISVSW